MKKTAIILLTEQCNKDCFYCFNRRPDAPQQQLPINEVKTFVNVLKNDFDFQTIIFSGGEPSLYPNFIEIIQYTASLGLAVKVFTNGNLMLLKDIGGFLGNNNVDEVRFSLNNFAVINTDTDYLRIENELHAFVRKLFPFNKIILNVIFSKQSSKFLPKLKSTCDKLKIHMYIQPLTLSQENLFYNKYSLSTMDDAGWNALNNFVRNCDLKTKHKEYIDLIQMYFVENKRPTYCDLPPIVVLLANGDIVPCIFRTDCVINNIFIDKLWNKTLDKQIEQYKFLQKASCFHEACLCMFKRH